MRLATFGVCVALVCPVFAADLVFLPEHLRPDPFGQVVSRDRTGPINRSRLFTIRAARGGYASAHLALVTDRPTQYQINVELGDRSGKLKLDVFREWFHFTDFDKNYYPDALVPLKTPADGAIPDPDNRVPKQTAAGFWVDVWIPPDAKPGHYNVRASVRASGHRGLSATLDIEVRDLVIPPEDAITIDHNSYGGSFIADQYPKLAAKHGNRFFQSDDYFALIHAYHRMFYEHRGVFHQLGYGHGGKVAPEFAPALTGSGKTRRIADWKLFDRHYGPLLDGTAFKSARRGQRPIPYVYLPINPEWPAQFLWWGEPGYETEFVNVVGEMEKHFREKGWTSTRFEMFFNHKKRYKAFPFDGDEIRFGEDNSYLKEYARLLKAAVPPDSPVKFIFRSDSSWSMEQQFRELAGVVKMWVLGSGMLSWQRANARMLRARGDVVWHYAGPAPVTQPAVSVTKYPLRTWIWNVDGYVHWLTVNPGADPWYNFDGGGTALVYSGERFNLEGPIPSVRLKFQRNALQDIALLESIRRPRAEVAKAYNDTSVDEWWNVRPRAADLDPREMTNPDLDEAAKPADNLLNQVEPDGWTKVRKLIWER
ncbi:MAG: DUF4091 domain-containing protein [Bryobacteraceae bacterium]